MTARRRWGGAVPMALALVTATPAVAGPPYLTDDPVPTDPGRWEIYAFGSGARASGRTDGEAGLDLNYGAAPDLQLTLVAPVGFKRGDGRHTGRGDVELAAKYRFAHQAPNGRGLDMAVFPAVTLPTGDRQFGERRPTLELPIWAQKEIGPWSMFGGGGYRLRPGDGRRDVWSVGLAVTRAVGERLSVGGEVHHEAAEEAGAGTSTVLALGAAWRASGHWSLLVSGGPDLRSRERDGASLYLSLKADY